MQVLIQALAHPDVRLDADAAADLVAILTQLGGTRGQRQDLISGQGGLGPWPGRIPSSCVPYRCGRGAAGEDQQDGNGKQTHESLLQVQEAIVAVRCGAAGNWWSWRDLNPRPQAFSAQIYMFSRLI